MLLPVNEVLSKLKSFKGRNNFDYRSTFIDCGEDSLELGALIYSPEPDNDDYTLITGCIHGDEPGGSCLTELINEFSANTIIIPVANPYGYVNETRWNHNNIDLNRYSIYRKPEYEQEFILSLLDEFNPNVIDVHQTSINHPYACISGSRRILEINRVINRLMEHYDSHYLSVLFYLTIEKSLADYFNDERLNEIKCKKAKNNGVLTDYDFIETDVFDLSTNFMNVLSTLGTNNQTMTHQAWIRAGDKTRFFTLIELPQRFKSGSKNKDAERLSESIEFYAQALRIIYDTLINPDY